MEFVEKGKNYSVFFFGKGGLLISLLEGVVLMVKFSEHEELKMSLPVPPLSNCKETAVSGIFVDASLTKEELLRRVEELCEMLHKEPQTQVAGSAAGDIPSPTNTYPGSADGLLTRGCARSSSDDASPHPCPVVKSQYFLAASSSQAEGQTSTTKCKAESPELWE